MPIAIKARKYSAEPVIGDERQLNILILAAGVSTTLCIGANAGLEDQPVIGDELVIGAKGQFNILRAHGNCQTRSSVTMPAALLAFLAVFACGLRLTKAEVGSKQDG